MSQPSPVDMPPRQHFTISIEQVHQIGYNRLPDFDHVAQRIEATEPLDHIPYMFDAASEGYVDRGLGCARVGRSYPLTLPGMQAANLFLEKPLAAGKQADIRYTTWFNYQAPPQPELKRYLGPHPMEKLDITVRFPSDDLPRAVWWTEWTGEVEDDRIENPEFFAPRPVDGSPHNISEVRAVRYNIAARTILGFTWEWE